MVPTKGKKPRVHVIGAGALGCWTAFHLRKAGCEVTLFDFGGPGHFYSSSGGETRVSRAAYGADLHYSQMVPHALKQWRELEQATGLVLYHPTGVLWMHTQPCPYLEDSERILGSLNLPFQPLDKHALSQRFAVIANEDLQGAFWEPNAGVLMASRACKALARRCREAGVVFRLIKAEPGPSKGEALRGIVDEDGETHLADHFVFACGPWLRSLFQPLLNAFLTVTRQDVCFFKVPKPSTSWRKLPVWIEFGDVIYYGLPDVDGGGLKVAIDKRGEAFDPDTSDRIISNQLVSQIRAFLAHRFPGLDQAPLVNSRICQYTNTPDGELLFDRHPAWKNLWLLGGGSGHAFKLAPVVGARVAQVILGKETQEPRWRLDPKRVTPAAKTQFQRGEI